jgi:hypothetical protein
MTDKNILYVEQNHITPYLYLYGQTVRNSLMCIDPVDFHYISLSKGGIPSVSTGKLNRILEDLKRTAIDFEVRYISKGYFKYEGHNLLRLGLVP